MPRLDCSAGPEGAGEVTCVELGMHNRCLGHVRNARGNVRRHAPTIPGARGRVEAQSTGQFGGCTGWACRGEQGIIINT